MTEDDAVPFVSLDDGDLDLVLEGQARATPELIDAVDARLCATATSVDDAVAAVAYVASLHLASTNQPEWQAVRQLLDSGEIAVDDIAARVETGLAGNPDAAAGAEALAALLLSRLPMDAWPQLPAMFVYVLGSAVLAGCRARPVRRLPWAQLVFELLVTRPTADPEFPRDDTWVRLVHLLADIARTSAEEVGDTRLYGTAVEVLNATLGDADEASLGSEHRRRLARSCLVWVRNGGPPKLLETGLRTALDGADHAEGIAKLDLQDLAARTYSLRADFDEQETDRDAAAELWASAARDADQLGERVLAVRLRVNLASELGLLGKLTGDEAVVRRSIATYYAARRYATRQEEHAHILSGLANRYRQLYDLTSRCEHLERSIKLGKKAIAGLHDDHARSVALNNQATRYRRRYEDLGNPDDIDTAITLAEEAVALMPPSRIERSKWLANLSQHYRLRAELNGRREDVRRARRNARGALRSGPALDDSALDAYVSAELLTSGLSATPEN